MIRNLHGSLLRLVRGAGGANRVNHRRGRWIGIAGGCQSLAVAGAQRADRGWRGRSHPPGILTSDDSSSRYGIRFLGGGQSLALAVGQGCLQDGRSEVIEVELPALVAK